MDILNRITLLREGKKWTEYQLAVKAALPQSTISSWYRKKMLPSISSLEKVCSAFDMTLSQFFSDDEVTIAPNKGQRELLREWERLTAEQKKALVIFLKTL